ncbi:MAG: ABC transporter permease [Clostridia bacterium]|nr:ABC transporter permease [Clostridia bacterium]
MGKYLLKRILFSIFSLVVVIGIVMLLVYSLIKRSVIFQTDDMWTKKNLNERTMYEYTMYQKYGYLTFVDYGSFLKEKYTEKYGDSYESQADYIADRDALKKPDAYESNASVQEFKTKYDGDDIVYLKPETYSNGSMKPGGRPYLLAVHEKSVFSRLWNYFTGLITVEHKGMVQDENLTDRYVRFEKDPYSWAGFALVGSGTQHKYLLYFDERFPFIHQNLFHFNFGTSYTTYRGQEITTVISDATGDLNKTLQQFPAKIGTDEREETAIDFHSLQYNASGTTSPADKENYTDNYTVASFKRTGLSMLGNSFVIGLASVFISYAIGVSVGILMSRKKDKLIDKVGKGYIVFMSSVPSLAYIFIVAAIGTSLLGIPLKFASFPPEKRLLAYILPTISLSLGSIGSLMKWTRRYMIDQMNSDYVKFARAEGMSEKEIYNKHIARNAFIYLIHGIPSSILFCLTGALMTERVYGVPGVGGLLINAITLHDNAVIVAMVAIMTTIAIVGQILGDLLLAKYDPRISLSSDSGGGRK